MGARKPRGAQRVGRRVHDRGIKGGNVPGNFVPAVVNLVAKTKVEGQVGPHLEIVLNKHLRALEASAILRTNACVPTVDIAQQEVSIFKAGSGHGTGVTL